MKIPKTFIPEKGLDEKTGKLEVYLDFEPVLVSPEKIVFENLSFEQLKRLASMEEKLYELKIKFEYKKGKYEIIYSSYCPHHPTKGMLTLTQYSPQDNMQLEELIGGLEEIVKESPRLNVLYQLPPDNWSIVEFHPKKFSNGIKKLEQFFQKGELYLLSHLNIEKTSIHAEYRELTEQEYKLYTKELNRKL